MIVDAATAQSTDRLQQYLRWAGGPNLPFAIGLWILWAVVGSPFVGVLAAGVTANIGLVVWASRLAGRGRVASSVYVYCAGVWVLALGVVLGGERLYVMSAGLAVLPLTLALPYVTERAVVAMSAVATTIVVIAGVPFVADWSLSLDDISATTLDVVVAVGTFILAAATALSVWHTRFTLREIRLGLEGANEALVESERTLEARVLRRTAELEQANRELTAARDEALAANRHKSEFLANMSHELRTPLNAIVGFSEVLEEQIFGELEPKQLEYCHDIHESGLQLLALINNILDIAKVEAGRWDLRPSEVDLGALVDDGVMAHQARAEAAGVMLRVVRSDQPQPVVADPSALRRVVDVLVDNAVKFTPEGGAVDVRVVTLDGETVLDVADTGIGVTTEDQAVIFDEFRQAEAHYTHKREGTGLGLALARRMVELHAGRIWVDSTAGEGSVFSVALPTEGLPSEGPDEGLQDDG